MYFLLWGKKCLIKTVLGYIPRSETAGFGIYASSAFTRYDQTAL